MLAVRFAKDSDGQVAHERFGMLLDDFNSFLFDDFLPVGESNEHFVLISKSGIGCKDID